MIDVYEIQIAALSKKHITLPLKFDCPVNNVRDGKILETM